jgi:serine/threonine protein phosphatase 1
MKYYVVADPHGFYSYLKASLEDAGFFKETAPHKLIVCGDVLDRGTEPAEIVDFLLELASKDMLILIRGNHEDLFSQCLQDISNGKAYDIACGCSHHYSNRTWHSILQLTKMKESEAVEYAASLVARARNTRFYRELLPLCVDYFETDHYVFCHGWIPVTNKGDRYAPIYEYDPDWREADVTAWRSARWYNGMEMACERQIKEPDKTIVCGHWHTSFGHSKYEGNGTYRGDNDDLTPFCAEGIVALDGCTVRSKCVNCVIIED